MKVLLQSPQSSNTSSLESLSCNPTALNLNTPDLQSSTNINPTTTSCHEPTSVLDLQHSPNPTTTTNTTTSLPPSNNANHNHHHHLASFELLENLEGWDSILSELGGDDDSTNHTKLWPQSNPYDNNSNSHLNHQLSDLSSSQPFDSNQSSITLPPDYTFCDLQNLNPNFGPFDRTQHHHHLTRPQPNLGLDIIDDLIRAAQSFESNDSNLLQQSLARLNQHLKTPIGKPLQRVAYYFKEALQRLASSPTQPTRLTSFEIVNTIRAFKTFSTISPVFLFSAFAANQAILEAVEGSTFIHIIDFDIEFGCHWASFMRELIDKFEPNKLNSMTLRITAIVSEEFGTERNLISENLTHFGHELNINVFIDFVTIQTFENSSFKSVKFIDGERLAVHLSPTLSHRIGNSRTGISKFLADLRKITPSIVVMVDKEIGVDTGTTSFSVNFMGGMEFYTGMLESLDVASAGGFVGGGDSVRRVEMFVLRPKIVAAVEAAAANTVAGRWREGFVAAEMRVVGFSQFADSQAEGLVKRAQIGGFQAAKRQGEMMLYWHERPLVSISAWRC